VYSLKFGPRASSNPWGAIGLEWETTSPPPTHNFVRTPLVNHDAYEYKPKEAAVVG
jgi:cytochrome c oxidase subunit 1